MAGDCALDKLYSQTKNLLLSKRSLTTGEIATYAGHRKIWQRIIDDGCAYALVLEDDFHIADKGRFQVAIADCLSASQKWDIVKFFDLKPKRIVHRKKIGATDLVAFRYPASGAVAYLISRDAACRLLSRRRIFRQVDVDLSWPWEFGLVVWSIYPSLVEEISSRLGGSHLEDMRLSKRAKRSLIRGVWGNFVQAWKLLRAFIYRLSAYSKPRPLPSLAVDSELSTLREVK